MPRAAVALVLALVLLPLVPAAASGDAVDGSCVRHDQRVRLAEGDPATYHLAAWLCGDPGPGPQTLVIASPTGLTDHAYWDWPQEPETYSFVRHATDAGLVVLNYDRIGTGSSDRPPAALVTVQSEAYVLHQLVGTARAGGFGGVAFDRVVHVGNSLSTFIGVTEAELYGGVDGLINTGILVGPRPDGLLALFSAFYPAQFDPKFAGRDDIPPGYATTLPGARAQFFYAPASSPATVALDEALKDTATLGEAATFPSWWAGTRLVDVPILSVVGDRDILFCSPRCEQGGLEAQRERLWWSDATCLELVLLEDAGHFVQLHPRAAEEFRALSVDWIERRVGLSAAQPASAPCVPT